MHKELSTLIKALTALVQLVFVYLFITWTYSGLAFIIGSFIG